MGKLWESNHAYYCSEGNYYSNDCHFEYKSWSDFFEEMGNSDMDYNLVYRWDWKLPGDDDCKPQLGPDPNYRDSRLLVFFMQQRKARAVSCEVEVCQADEPIVREWLEKRWQYLRDLWSPLAPTGTQEGQ